MFLLPRPSMNTSNSAYLMAAEQEANESQDDGKVDKWHHSYSFYYPAATPLSPQSLLSPSMDLPGLVHTEKKIVRICSYAHIAWGRMVAAAEGSEPSHCRLLLEENSDNRKSEVIL